jgi:hypothetical protein
MEPQAIALIKSHGQDVGMELLLPLLIAVVIGILAQAAGTDSRTTDPRCTTPSW